MELMPDSVIEAALKVWGQQDREASEAIQEATCARPPPSHPPAQEALLLQIIRAKQVTFKAAPGLCDNIQNEALLTVTPSWTPPAGMDLPNA